MLFSKSIFPRGLRVAAAISAVIALSQAAFAQDTLFIYGPGGPAPAMKEAAAEFEKMAGVKVEMSAGPTPKWLEKAKNDADLIFSGSETMMTDFVYAMDGQLSHPGAPREPQKNPWFEGYPQAWRASISCEWRRPERRLGRHGGTQG